VGRPRDRQIDAAVLEATLPTLDESRYGRLTLEEVARRAGPTKPASTVAGPSRQRLVLAAPGQRLGEARAPDIGCTLCDRDEFLKLFVAALRRMPPNVIGPLSAGLLRRPRPASRVHDHAGRPAARGRQEYARPGAPHGDLCEDVDPDLILDLIGAFVHYRTLFGHARTTDAEIERAVDARLQGIAADYPRLLDHSRRVSGDPNLHPPQRLKSLALRLSGRRFAWARLRFSWRRSSWETGGFNGPGPGPTRPARPVDAGRGFLPVSWRWGGAPTEW
jgi:AcrR family transcriptional regulator